MALAEPLPSKRAPPKKVYSSECRPFDVNLLCAKLEAVKLEQDLERARRRHRDGNGTRKQEPPTAESRRPLITASRTETRSNAQQTEESNRPLSSNDKKDGHPLPFFSAFSLGKSKNDSMRDAIPSKTFTLGSEHPHLSRRSSTGGLERVRLAKAPDASNRKSVPITTNVHFDESKEPERDSAQKSSPIDLSKRRSKTFPMQLSKLTSRQRPVSAYDYSSTLKSRPRQDDSQESPMGLVNEYTISFDLADMLRDECNGSAKRPHERQEDSNETSPVATGLRSRSLLNLSSLLRKDRTDVRTNEVDITRDDIQENPRPLTSANGHHARQKSLPIHLHTDALLRCKRDEREKKRRTFIGFFKIF